MLMLSHLPRCSLKFVIISVLGFPASTTMPSSGSAGQGAQGFMHARQTTTHATSPALHGVFFTSVLFACRCTMCMPSVQRSEEGTGSSGRAAGSLKRRAVPPSLDSFTSQVNGEHLRIDRYALKGPHSIPLQKFLSTSSQDQQLVMPDSLRTLEQ